MDFNKILFDPEVFEINLLPQRSTFKTYLSETDYKNNITNETLLNGTWKGIYLEKFDEEILKYLDINSDISSLIDIEVPLSNELQGLGTPQYVNTQFPFDGKISNKFGEPLSINNPCTLYIKDYEINLDSNKKYILNFKGFETGLFLFINNKEVGYSENLYLDSEFDITSYLVNGKNRIAAIVFKYSSSSYLLSQDFYRFSGIFRDVTLSIVPKKYIEDIEIKTKNNGDVFLNLSGDLQGFLLKIRVFDVENNEIYSNEFSENNINFHLENVKLWSQEEPNLYHLEISVFNENNLIEIIKETFGFKEVKIVNNVLFLNDKRVVLKGINRHEWNKNRGRNISKEDIDFDLRFLKNHNVNAIRCSHYPNNTYFYEEADKIGFLVMDECCLESHGTLTNYKFPTNENSLPKSDKKWEAICVNKIKRMYLRDKNHPSIFMWSLGNESGSGSVFVSMKNALKELNSEALTHYENIYYDKNYLDASDVFSEMYTKPKDVLLKIEKGLKKPYILCEYAHAMGNSLGNLDEYIELTRNNESFQGGFIWDYIDQGLEMVNETGEKCLSYGGDFLDKPNDADFCCNGVIFANRNEAYKSSKARAMKYYYTPIKIDISNEKVRITNEYMFKTTEDILFTLEGLIDQNVTHKEDIKVNLKPKEFCEIPLKDLFDLKSKSEILVRIYGVFTKKEGVFEENYEVVYEEKIIKEGEYKLLSKSETFEVFEGKHNIGIKGDHFEYLFSLSTYSFNMPGLVSLKINGEEYLYNNVAPTIFRPTTSNDIGNLFFINNSALSSNSKNYGCISFFLKPKIEKDKVTIKYTYFMNLRKLDRMNVTYIIDKNGHIEVKVQTNKFKSVKSLALVGLRFTLPKKFNKFSYLGLGPYENYTDRYKGVKSGIYNSTPEDEYVNYIKPQECGNHEKTREIIIEGESSKLRISKKDKLLSFKYLPYDEFTIDNANHLEDLPKSRHNYLTICGFTRGVGGDDSWGAPVHKKYTLKAKKKYLFSFFIEGLKK